MPHRGQALLLGTWRRVAGLLLFTTIGCDRSGKVVVLLDSTIRGPDVEVVAFPRNDTSSRDTNTRVNAASRVTTPLDDSVTMLAARFRALRDSLNDEVTRLAGLDRRTRAYAVRYAEVRRRTLAAEQLRARRDSMSARAAARDGRGSRSSGDPPSEPADPTFPPLSDIPGLQRATVNDSVVVLSLAKGSWYVGVARSGRLLMPPSRLTIVGEHDTLHIRPR